MADWASNFKCWDADKAPVELDRFCGICGANKPLENHETWCLYDPDRGLKDDGGFWLDEEADTCVCSRCDELTEEEIADWLDDAPTEVYHAPEKPANEDWGLRDECLLGARGLGGAPTRATTLPVVPAERKTYPVASGVLDYFPDALAAVAYVSWKGNDQHNPGQPLHWDREKSTDEADTMMRHFLQRGSLDTDGLSHTAKMVWRALAFLQKEIEADKRGF